MHPDILEKASDFIESLNGQQYSEIVVILASMIATICDIDKGELSPELLAFDIYLNITNFKED